MSALAVGGWLAVVVWSVQLGFSWGDLLDPLRPTVPVPPLVVDGAAAQHCPTWRGKVYLEQSITLPKGCLFRGVELWVRNQSNLTLDMNGAHFYATSDQQRGLWIMNDNPRQPSQQVVFRNAVFNGYLEGGRIHRNISAREAKEVKAGVLSADDLRATATHHVRIENVQFLNSLGDGLVLHGGVHHVVLHQSVVAGSGGVGVYLGDMTHDIEIRNSKFYVNGHTKPNGVPRLGTGLRENIAVDGSFNNKIHHNVIRDASQGGIALYKNCYEHAHELGQLPRVDHAHSNQIYQNTIVNNHGFGVHIAERQDRELSSLECADPLYFNEGGRYYRDYAHHNVVRNNRIEGNGKDIIVHDDNNSISNNRAGSIYIGSLLRLLGGEPVRNTTVQGNSGTVHYQYGGS